MVQITEKMAQRMALHVGEMAGIVFLAATPGRGDVKCAIRNDLLHAAPEGQRRFFFATEARASRVLGEMQSASGGATINGTVVLRTPISEIDQVVTACAARIGIAVIDTTTLAAALKRMSSRICQTYEAVQSSGVMKRLNRGYREARVSGEKLPSYELWLIEKLMPMMRLDTVGTMLAALGL